MLEKENFHFLQKMESTNLRFGGKCILLAETGNHQDFFYTQRHTGSTESLHNSNTYLA